MRARIVPSYGATEAKVPDIVDAIVDVTETGSSLRKHGLKVLETLLTSRTELVANVAAYADEEKRAAMQDLALLLQGAIRARGQVLLKLNVAGADLAGVLEVLPSMTSPTVTELAKSDHRAVETVVAEARREHPAAPAQGRRCHGHPRAADQQDRRVTGERPAAPAAQPAAGGLPEALALLFAFLAGAGVALQSYVNGKLAGEVGATLLASLLSFVVGLIALLGLSLARGSLRAARQRLRSAGRPPLWYFAGGLAGAYLVSSTAAGAPKIGVALVTVALVAGQTGGSLGVDAVGLGPSGPQPVTAPRLVGVGLAVAAVLLSSFVGGGHGDLHLGLLLLVAGAGIGVAFQQAANGRLQQVTGDAGIAALINFGIGTVVLALLLAVTRPHDVTLAAPPLLYLGGLLGAAFVLTAAATVRVLGVLRLSLVAISGQSAGALVLDALDPAPGRSLTWATFVGVALTIVAVGVSRR